MIDINFPHPSLLKPCGQVAELAESIEGLLYNEESEEEEEKEEDGRKGKEIVGGDGEEELKSILLAVHLSWQRIGLMERRGFKVISVSI